MIHTNDGQAPGKGLAGWTPANSLCALLLLGTAATPLLSEELLLLLVAAWGLCAFGAFWVSGLRAGVRMGTTANLLTATRVVLVTVTCVVAGWAVAVGAAHELTAYAVFGLLVLAWLSDYLDGRAARRWGATSWGARLDEEADAFFVAALSVLVHRSHGVGAWILPAGALRYIYLLSLSIVPDAPRRSAAYTWFSRTVCAVSVAGLVLITAPFVPHGISNRVAAPVMAALLLSFSWAWVGNIAAELPSRAVIYGTVRSFLLYYAVPLRRRRQARFYRKIVPLQSGTIYDIGAHLGSRTRVFLSLGRPVVAVEPQQHFFSLLSASLTSRAACTLVHGAVGAQSGRAEIRISDRHPTVSSLSPEWIAEGCAAGVLDGVQYNRSETVPLYTLDELMERYGQAAFVKIDVEGFEYEVLRGLSTPVPALSFELVPSSLATAELCLTRLEQLGSYGYFFAPAERTRFLSSQAQTSQELLASLAELPFRKRSGDIYAFRLAAGHGNGNRHE